MLAGGSLAAVSEADAHVQISTFPAALHREMLSFFVAHRQAPHNTSALLTGWSEGVGYDGA